jgi:uncharacterized protein YcbX
MQISEIWRFPVKSLQGERLPQAQVGPAGIEGDRAWALLDVETERHLTARREPGLLMAAASVTGTGADLGVQITLPDGSVAADDDALSAWIGRPVRLVSTGEGGGRFETQADETETGEWFTWEGGDASFHDSGRRTLSLVSESAFGTWDRRRFRINLILDADGDLDLVGQQVQVGEVKVDVAKRIDRCVMTTRPQPAHEAGPAIEQDLSVLRTINREFDTFLGVGGTIAATGAIAVGDAVTALGPIG